MLHVNHSPFIILLILMSSKSDTFEGRLIHLFKLQNYNHAIKVMSSFAVR